MFTFTAMDGLLEDHDMATVEYTENCSDPSAARHFIDSFDADTLGIVRLRLAPWRVAMHVFLWLSRSRAASRSHQSSK